MSASAGSSRSSSNKAAALKVQNETKQAVKGGVGDNGLPHQGVPAIEQLEAGCSWRTGVRPLALAAAEGRPLEGRGGLYLSALLEDGRVATWAVLRRTSGRAVDGPAQ